MARDITSRRLTWLDNHVATRGRSVAVTPRQAFEQLFFEQMGLDHGDLAVVAESRDKVVWESRNRGSLLEACRALDLDTRHVCRRVNEQATQAFFSRLDPRLRLHRSYVEIRPHATRCREWITRISFDDYLRAVPREGGAVVVMDDRVIGRGVAPCVVDLPRGFHASSSALCQAEECLGDGNLCGAVLFAVGAPWVECVARAGRTRLTRIVCTPLSATSESGERTRLPAGRPGSDRIEMMRVERLDGVSGPAETGGGSSPSMAGEARLLPSDLEALDPRKR